MKIIRSDWQSRVAIKREIFTSGVYEILFFFVFAIGEQCGTSAYRYRTRVGIVGAWRGGGDEEEEEKEEKGIDFSAGLCEMKPGRAIAINNDKNNPIRRLFDLSAPIFRARSIRLITILLDLGGEPHRAAPCRAEPSRTEAGSRVRAIAVRARSNLSNRARRTIFAIVISITSHFPSLRRIFFVVGPSMIWIKPATHGQPWRMHWPSMPDTCEHMLGINIRHIILYTRYWLYIT